MEDNESKEILGLTSEEVSIICEAIEDYIFFSHKDKIELQEKVRKLERVEGRLKDE